MSRRQGNRPDRRVAAAGTVSAQGLEALRKRVSYTGSASHKLQPGDYGFKPSHNPRPSKSPCDKHRAVLQREAKKLFAEGLRRGMVSTFSSNGVPKYVWAVDKSGEVYEAKTKPERETDYHGYRLGADETQMRAYILEQWKLRCPKR